MKILFNHKNKIIIWPRSQKRFYKNLLNNKYKKFIKVIRKIDSINIILKFKYKYYLKKEIFFIQKNDIY